jgi:SOS response regulatory protein OraA/RecX
VFTELQKEQDQLVKQYPSHTDLPGLAVAVNEAWNDCQVARRVVSQLESALGVNEKQELRGLEEDPFLRVRMNALALKQRIRDRLRHRKFEMSRMERSYRHSVNGEWSCL